MPSEFEKLVKEIKDYPLNLETKKYFVNRETELYELNYWTEFYEGGIIGIAGERGIGKTTLFNLIQFKNKDKHIINIIDRENKLTIIANILLGIYEYCEKKRYNEIKKKILNLYKTFLETTTKKMNIGVSYIVNAQFSIAKKESHLIKNVTKELKKIIDEISKKQSVVFILDEIDKESKEEILLILDAIKIAFKENKVTLLVALPFSFYKEYIKNKDEAKDTYNLENVFDYMYFLPNLSDGYIEELIKLRIKDYIEEDALAIVVKYAEGNPRKAISLIKEAGVHAIMAKNKKITENNVKYVLKKQFKLILNEIWKLNEDEIETLKLIKEEKSLKKVAETIEKKLRKSKATAYRLIERLEKKEIIYIKKRKILLPTKTELILEILF